MRAAGLYVHVPFCARACPYCDFDFKVDPRPPVGAYLKGLAAELDAKLERPDTPNRFDTIYLGGGTPSLMGPHGLARLLSWIRGKVTLAPGLECTVELNPEHVDAPLVRALVEEGVTRVSLGAQTLAGPGLVQLGRVHTREQILRALNGLAATGMEVSVDLLIGWPGQTQRQLAHDIGALAEASAGHLSVYALTIEEGARWRGLVRRGRRMDPDPDRQADLLIFAEQRLAEIGYRHYEISNYCRPGREARHNMKYWAGEDYLGLGPSAASATYSGDGAVVRRTNRRGFENWQTSPATVEHEERLDPASAAAEGLWLGLRRLAGLDIEAFLARFPAVTRDWVEKRVSRQVERGNLTWDAKNVLRLADGRWVWHDEVAVDLLG